MPGKKAEKVPLNSPPKTVEHLKSVNYVSITCVNYVPLTLD
jgi:hypothetical protein